MMLLLSPLCASRQKHTCNFKKSPGQTTRAFFVFVKRKAEQTLFEQISSKDNRQIKRYVKLCTSKSARTEAGAFPVEGVKLVYEAVRSGVLIDTLFVTQQCFERLPHQEEIIKASKQVFLIEACLESKLSQVQTPQGVYAIARKLDNFTSCDTIEHKGKSILLVDLQDAGNVGTIIRTAEAVGIDRVLVTQKTCDIYNPKVIRSTMGSLFRMQVHVVPDAAETMKRFQSHGAVVYASVVDADAQSIGTFSFSQDSLLLIGNEGNGLPQTIAQIADHRITIPMKGNTESLNASMAACILMWEMNR